MSVAPGTPNHVIPFWYIDNSWFQCLLCPVLYKLYQPSHWAGKRYQHLCPKKLLLQHWGEYLFLWILWQALAAHQKDGSKYSKYKSVYCHLVLVVVPTLSDFDFPFSFFQSVHIFYLYPVQMEWWLIHVESFNR